jgi:hypothetical protein
MSITGEILTVLSKEPSPLIYDDLSGSLTPPKNSAHNWRTRVTHSVRTLVELGFLAKGRTDCQLRQATYSIAAPGRAWLATKVWVVQEDDMCEYQGLHGAFSSEELANDYIKSLPEDRGAEYSVDCRTLDQPEGT